MERKAAFRAIDVQRAERLAMSCICQLLHRQRKFSVRSRPGSDRNQERIAEECMVACLFGFDFGHFVKSDKLYPTHLPLAVS